MSDTVATNDFDGLTGIIFTSSPWHVTASLKENGPLQPETAAQIITIIISILQHNFILLFIPREFTAHSIYCRNEGKSVRSDQSKCRIADSNAVSSATYFTEFVAALITAPQLNKYKQPQRCSFFRSGLLLIPLFSGYNNQYYTNKKHDNTNDHQAQQKIVNQ
jgi:hypothetical protein